MASKTAVVTGAGSGVGQAAAIGLARAGWTVAILGRRESALAETVAQAGEAGDQLRPFSCDVGKRDQVRAAAGQIFEQLGPVELL